MTTIYLIRHAQSEGNLGKCFQGQSDTALTPHGLAQAEALQARFREIPLHAVYASPLSRAVQTAQAVALPHNLTVNIEPGLIEMQGGKMENMPLATLLEEHGEQFTLFDQQPHLFVGLEGTERITSVYERVIKTMDEIIARHPGQTVAVVAHGLPIRCYTCHASAKTIEQLGGVRWAQNTGVFHITHQDGKLALLRENDLSHLGPDLL